MTIVSPELKQALEDLKQKIKSSNQPNDNLATNKAEVPLMENQHSEAKVRGFTVVQDEPVSILGGNKGPTPTDYCIASVGFCENVIFSRNAVLLGLSIDSMDTSVSGVWDRRGLFNIDSVQPYFKSITVETKVTTKDAVEKVVEVARLTHRRCPVHATLIRATEMIFKLVVNGENTAL